MSDGTLDHIYPGIGRLHYFLAKIGLIAAMIGVVLYFGPESPVIRVAGLVSMVAGVVLDVKRLRNIGVSEWYAFLRFVPYVGSIIGIGLQSAQTGWIESRQLDRAGIIIVALHVAFVAFFIYLMLRTPSALPDVLSRMI